MKEDANSGFVKKIALYAKIAHSDPSFPNQYGKISQTVYGFRTDFSDNMRYEITVLGFEVF
jgi:hypothetical protein